jgi:predicted esterase
MPSQYNPTVGVPMQQGDPRPGAFVRQWLDEYANTGVYHGLYLPEDWTENQSFPLIVEYAGNGWTVETCKLGFFQSGGKGFLWAVMPYVSEDGREYQLHGWGDREATVNYCVRTVRQLCERFHADPGRIFLTGFSRGARAIRNIGLADEGISSLWRAFLPHSGYHVKRGEDGECEPSLDLLNGRQTFLTFGETDSLREESLRAAEELKEAGQPVEFHELPGVGHTDDWIREDGPVRQRMRAWLSGLAFCD